MRITVDDVDLTLIRALQSNPSETNKALANRVGMSDVGVSNRIRRLIENNVIRPTLFYDAESLGLRMYCAFEICIQGRGVAETAAEIGQIDGLQTVATLVGTPDVAALFFARDHEHVEEMRRSVAAVRGVHTLRVILSTKLAKYMTAYGAYAMLDHDE